ncbi:hypothetical protein A9Q84_04225 [Halobacteriovorax marinus]|uniref:Lipoprotein n=1 Tax=Halobacteriovorax marinus TaxID=97084 RepID=A0A1Y5FAB5_9BACT|nr:hypothetical protein A9Q84_04225 [Halobacteriovorax marinus]
MRNKIFLILSLLLLTSCATDIDYHVPLNRFDSPETKGKFLKGETGLNFGSSHKIVTAEVVETIFPSIFDATVDKDTEISRSHHLNSSVALGLLERLDFSFQNYGDGPNVVGLKFQFLGKPEIETKSGFKGALKLSYGAMDEEEGTLTVNLAGSGTRTYSGDIDVDVYEASLILGYRINPYVITYVNSLYSYHETQSTLTSNTFPTIVINGVVRTYGGLAGIRIGKPENHFFIKLETGYMKTKFEQHLSENTIPIGIAGDFTW